MPFPACCPNTPIPLNPFPELMPTIAADLIPGLEEEILAFNAIAESAKEADSA